MNNKEPIAPMTDYMISVLHDRYLKSVHGTVVDQTMIDDNSYNVQTSYVLIPINTDETLSEESINNIKNLIIQAMVENGDDPLTDEELDEFIIQYFTNFMDDYPEE